MPIYMTVSQLCLCCPKHDLPVYAKFATTIFDVPTTHLHLELKVLIAARPILLHWRLYCVLTSSGWLRAHAEANFPPLSVILSA